MKFERVSTPEVLVNEKCPSCNYKGHMTFVTYRGVGYDFIYDTVCCQDRAKQIRCMLCKANYKIPEELKDGNV